MKRPLVENPLSFIKDSYNSFSQNFTPGIENRIGICIAPRLCVIGEFSFSDKKLLYKKWIEEITYDNYSDLEEKISSVIKRRYLYNRVASVSFSIPEVYTTSNFNPSAELENQNILPKGLEWDNIDYTVQSEGEHLFTAIRKADMHFWNDFFNRVKIIPGCIIPTGYFWPKFFPDKKNITCNLPYGKLEYNNEFNEGTVYIPSPNKKSEDTIEISFNEDVTNKYKDYCHSALLALESILSSFENPNFNLNFDMHNANNALRLETLTWRWMRVAILAFGGVSATIIIIFLLLYLWGLGLGKQREAYNILNKEIKSLRKENALIQSGIREYKELLSQRSLVSKILSESGKVVQDSLWFSELKIVKDKSYKVIIIGHSLNESCISKFLNNSESFENVKSVKLEYSEKLSQTQVAKMTKWKRKIPLYRFKIEMIFAG